MPSLIVVFSLFSLLLYMFGIFINVQKIEENQCSMTYMYEYPKFLKIDLVENKHSPAYGLYAYSEGLQAQKMRNMEFRGAPVLFIPGNGGSYKQVRSLASVALRKATEKHGQIDFFTDNRRLG
ncbi:GPI inositol-deacylase-like [Topomyia yanbarensis]|uniref:GPI inositol-deacylase-like n=1 Tax=Topomyia yanbarensis TaxID=2498891 RepID=UPI00273CD62A|nr:GPI inositol-deacylase-like [Topomyia yanbarensis]